MKIKILYLIPNLKRAGTERHLINLVSHLDKNRFEPFVCCLKNFGALGLQFHRDGGRIACFNQKSIYNPLIIIKLYRLIKEIKPDIIHSYLFGFDYLATITARILGVSIVISSRRELAYWQKFYHRLLTRIGNLFTHKIISCSQAARDYALKQEGLPLHKIITVYNGIDLEEFYPRQKSLDTLKEFGFAPDELIVGMVTKFAEVKDIDTALQAMAKVNDSHPHVKYLLVGDGHLRTSMENKAKELKLDKNSRFIGKRDDIAKILSVMDIFLLTSLSEGLPNVILEAMACGIPVVATRVGGIPEACENEATGILLEPKDYNGIADAIIRLLKDENLRKEMGRRGREIVKNRFALPMMVEYYENLYSIYESKVINTTIKCPICKFVITTLVFKKQGNNFFKCKSCELVFQWPQPTLEFNNQRYQEWGDSHYLNEDKIKLDFSSSFDSRLLPLERYRKYNRLLDVGCSTGAFLVAAKDKGWDTYGVELSQPSAFYARDSRGLNVFAGTLKEAGYKNEYFDVVNIWAVLEHVHDPAQIVTEAYRILRRGGVMVFCVPNFNCLAVKLIGKKYRYICDGHLFYFTRNSIRKLLDINGFKLLDISSEHFSPLVFIEDLCGVRPETLKTQKKEREIVYSAKNRKISYFLLRPPWKTFMFMVRKFYLGEELIALAVK